MEALTCLSAPSLPSSCSFLRQPGPPVLWKREHGIHGRTEAKDQNQHSPTTTRSEGTPSQRQLVRTQGESRAAYRADTAPSTLPPGCLGAPTLINHTATRTPLSPPTCSWPTHVQTRTCALSPEQVPPIVWNPIYSPHRNCAFPRLCDGESVNPGAGCKFLIASLAQPALL